MFHVSCFIFHISYYILCILSFFLFSFTACKYVDNKLFRGMKFSDFLHKNFERALTSPGFTLMMQQFNMVCLLFAFHFFLFFCFFCYLVF